MLILYVLISLLIAIIANIILRVAVAVTNPVQHTVMVFISVLIGALWPIVITLVGIVLIIYLFISKSNKLVERLQEKYKGVING
jgi:hypothetical protein